MLKATTNAQVLESLINEHELVLVDFWAEWCVPCKQFSAVFERLASANSAVVFAKVNVAQETELAEAFHIQSIPHLMIFKQGIIIYSDSGNLPESALTELLTQAIAADVKAIREAIDKDEHA